MARHLFNPIRVLLPLLLALVLLVAVACGSAEQPTQAPVVAATQAPAVDATQVPAAQATKAPDPTEAMAQSDGKSGGHVRMSAYADTKDWDAKGSSSLSSVQAYSQLYNQVVQYGTTDTSEIVGDLAESWEVSSDGVTYTFKLLDNVKWQDGKDLTADDVVYSLSRYMDPDTKTARSGLFRNYTLPPAEGGIKKIDDLTFEMKLQFSTGAFMSFFAIDYVKILPKHLKDVDLNQAENIIEFKAGSGPFVLDEYQRGNSYKVSKNPDYFKDGRPYFDSIDHFIITDTGTLQAQFKAGQIDMQNGGFSSLSPTEYKQLADDLKGELILNEISPSFNVGLMINVKKEPFTDPRVRKAIYLALDRQQINSLLQDNTAAMATTIFLPGMGYTVEEAMDWPGLRQPKDEDIAEAKRLLAEAGFPDGFTTTYDARQVGDYADVCAVVKQQLKEALNIDGEIRTHESAAGYALFGSSRPPDSKGEWNLACQGEGMVVVDPDGVFGGVYRKGGTRNYTDWTNPKVEALFELQKLEQDPDKRRVIIKEVEDFLRSFEDNHWITVYWGKFFWLVHKDIKGFRAPNTVQYGFKHEDLWLDR
ncbi:MAG: ABC transporter substrate-binding protein [Stenotrophomonas maltophilia]